MRVLLVIVSSLIMLAATPAFAQNQAEKMIEQMANSAKTLDYKGYFTYERGMQSASYKIVHQLKGDQEKQRLVFLDGEPLEIINDGHSLKCIHAGEGGAKASHTESLNTLFKLNRPLSDIWNYYRAELAGKARVAGRAVVQINLLPKDQHRYPYMFYVDQETGLMLKMLVLGHKGRLLERFRYVAIDYTKVEDADLVPQIKDYTVVDHSDPKADKQLQKAVPHWQLKWMPDGFRQENPQMAVSKSGGKQHDALMYSDGLSAFSVFIEEVEVPASQGTSDRIGSTSVVSRYVQLNNKKVYQITVIGEIPVSTAQQLVAAVRPLP